ncbi:hypothetical protein [Oceanirhabdus seepicola]|uniref:Uncharacterized protein n=1 Tax=Oceanirhabdus seepicola TaxID=2828781 RepID=A0A9J6P631_9CLOT|nr:hypothetical protein [Oceanirhabdus seepicola]MCM1990952.1 hypothetical protein [Oceanirhabdus seepicola]
MKSFIYILAGFFILNITIRAAKGDFKSKEKNIKGMVGIIFTIIITFIICKSI